MSTTKPWVCPCCKVEIRAPFCAQCGERPIPKIELTLRFVFGKLLHALTDVDGRVVRSYWRLLRHPGTLTVAYMDGIRKLYASPFQLFLLANVLFFAIQSLTNINIFGASLDSHLHQQDWSPLAQTLLDRRLESTHNNLALYAPIFDQAVILNAKSLIILMVVPFAMLLPLVFLRSRLPFMGHVVFALHL